MHGPPAFGFSIITFKLKRKVPQCAADQAPLLHVLPHCRRMEPFAAEWASWEVCAPILWAISLALRLCRLFHAGSSKKTSRGVSMITRRLFNLAAASILAGAGPCVATPAMAQPDIAFTLRRGGSRGRQPGFFLAQDNGYCRGRGPERHHPGYRSGFGRRPSRAVATGTYQMGFGRYQFG